MNRRLRVVLTGLLVILIGMFLFNIFDVPKTEEVSSEVEMPGELTEEPSEQEEPVVEPEPELPKFKVVIDPGHGGQDSGAEGASGSYEKDFNLSLSRKIAGILEQEPRIEIYMTREEDVFLSSESRERPNFANELKADLFLSIHANTFPDPTVTGTETFYYDEDSKWLADIIHRHVAKATGFRDRGVSEGDFFVLRDTHMPAALLEIGYITNPADEQKMLTEEFQQDVAEAIANGIKEYLEL